MGLRTEAAPAPFQCEAAHICAAGVAGGEVPGDEGWADHRGLDSHERRGRVDEGVSLYKRVKIEGSAHGGGAERSVRWRSL